MQLGTRPYTDKEISLMLNSLQTPRDRCLFLLGIKTGFRISELLSIELSQLMEYGALKDSVTVSKSKVKGKVASRSIPLSQDLKIELAAYIKELPAGQKYLFESQKGNKLSRVQAWRALKQAALNLKLTGKIACHSMRKFYAKNIYILSGKDLVITQRCLGHRSINSTISYLSVNDEDITKLILSSQTFKS